MSLTQLLVNTWSVINDTRKISVVFGRMNTRIETGEIVLSGVVEFLLMLIILYRRSLMLLIY